MDEWLGIERNRLNDFNLKGVSMMKRELSFAYTDNKPLSEYFKQRSIDGRNAFKKANIAEPIYNSFESLSKLRNILSYINIPILRDYFLLLRAIINLPISF